MPDRRRRIALVTDAIGPFHRGGKELRYYELAQRLAVRADVDVYTMKWWTDSQSHREGTVTYHALAPLLPLYSGGRRSIRQALVFAVSCLRLLSADFDVIEADHMPYVQLFTLRLVAAIRRRKLVVTWHEVWGPAYWRSYLGRLGAVGWWCERLAMRLPHVIIAASSPTAERLREFTHEKVKVIVAPNGLNQELITDAKAVADRAEVVVVGRLLAHKRVDLLLDALSLLRAQGIRATAFIVGTGPHYEILRAQAVRLGLLDTVEFRQDVHDERQLYGLLKAASVAVFPSEREGFGIAVLEALACGIPVITTSAPDNLATHLVLRCPDSGVICEPTPAALAEAIATALASAKQGRPPTDRNWLDEYDWTTITESVYAALS